MNLFNATPQRPARLSLTPHKLYQNGYSVARHGVWGLHAD